LESKVLEADAVVVRTGRSARRQVPGGLLTGTLRRSAKAARTEDGHTIAKGASVVIVRQSGGSFFVRESVEERLKEE